MFEFAKAVLRNPFRTGAVAPSSARLARALAREAMRGDPRVVLEVGAGNGAVTRALHEAAHADTELVAIDLHRGLLETADVPGGKVLADAAHPPIRHADVIVSGLPFGSMSEDDARNILLGLAAVSTRIVLFQYTERRLPLVREFFPGAEVVETVYANLPPAQVVASPLRASRRG